MSNLVMLVEKLTATTTYNTSLKAK